MLAIFVIYGLKKLKQIPAQYWLYCLILCANILVNVNFWMNTANPLIAIQFLYTIALSHVVRAQSFFFVSGVCFLSTFFFLNTRQLTLQDQQQLGNQVLQAWWQIVALISYVSIWTYFSYSNEIKNKIRFVILYRNIKELKKLKSIQNLLISRSVRKLNESRKEQQKLEVGNLGQATVIILQIQDF